MGRYSREMLWLGSLQESIISVYQLLSAYRGELQALRAAMDFNAVS